MNVNRVLLVINIFFLQSYLLRFNIGPYPSNLQEVLIGAQVPAFLYAIFKSKEPTQTIKNIRKHWVILSFAGLTILSILMIPVKNNIDFIRHSKFLFFALILSFIFLETFRTDDERKTGVGIMGIGAVFFGIFSAIYNLLGYNVTHDLRLLGPLDAAVYLAYYLTPFFIFFAIRGFEKPQKKSNIIYATILAVLIIATRSMGAIGGSILVLIFYFFKRSNLEILKRKSIKALIAIIVITAVAGIFYTKILPTIQTNNSSLDERGEIWRTAGELLKNPDTVFLGLGFGQFEHHYIQTVDQVLGHPPLDYHIIQPHNIFLLFIFHYGILGVIFILICIYKTLQKLVKFRKKPNLSVIISFGLLYFFLHGMIDTPFFKNDMLILLILFLEMGIGDFNHASQSVSNRKQAPSKPHMDRPL